VAESGYFCLNNSKTGKTAWIDKLAPDCSLFNQFCSLDEAQRNPGALPFSEYVFHYKGKENYLYFKNNSRYLWQNMYL